MAITYDDFLKTVESNNLSFVNDLHKAFLDKGCKVEIKEAKQGYVVTYVYMKGKKKIALMNYVFRKSGMLVRIYARHIYVSDTARFHSRRDEEECDEGGRL